MMREALDVLLYGFNNETLDFEGKYYNRLAIRGVRGVKLWLKPYQQPYPPLWYPTAPHLYKSGEMIPWVAEAGMNTCGMV